MLKEEKNNNKIFLSYHSSKIELAAHLSKYMERNDLETWYAPRDIRTSETWDEAIHNAIKECKAVVLLFCAQADSSKHVKREIGLADTYKKPIFWVRVERVEPNMLGYFLNSTQWLDWLDERDVSLEKLISDIRLTGTSNETSSNKLEASTPTSYSSRKIQNQWCKGVVAFDESSEAAECAARVYFSMAQKFPDSSVILPTGRSATSVFRAMVRTAREYDDCPFGYAQLISDTETFGVWSEHETSRSRHVNEMLLEPLKKMKKEPAADQIHLLSGIYTDSDPVKSAQKTIRMFPPSVHAVSVSPAGEILAYEVGTYNEIDEIIDDAPRIVEIGIHSKKYIDPNQPSKSIISIGLGTALSVNILLILVFDIQKANILSRLISGPVTAGIPATLLSMHPNAYILTTKSIAEEADITNLIIDGKNAKEAAEWIVQN